MQAAVLSIVLVLSFQVMSERVPPPSADVSSPNLQSSPPDPGTWQRVQAPADWLAAYRRRLAQDQLEECFVADFGPGDLPQGAEAVGKLASSFRDEQPSFLLAEISRPRPNWLRIVGTYKRDNDTLLLDSWFLAKQGRKYLIQFQRACVQDTVGHDADDSYQSALPMLAILAQRDCVEVPRQAEPSPPTAPAGEPAAPPQRPAMTEQHAVPDAMPAGVSPDPMVKIEAMVKSGIRSGARALGSGLKEAYTGLKEGWSGETPRHDRAPELGLSYRSRFGYIFTLPSGTWSFVTRDDPRVRPDPALDWAVVRGGGDAYLIVYSTELTDKIASASLRSMAEGLVPRFGAGTTLEDFSRTAVDGQESGEALLSAETGSEGQVKCLLTLIRTPKLIVTMLGVTRASVFSTGMEGEFRSIAQSCRFEH